METQVQLKDLKMGDFFKRKETSKKVFVRGSYNRGDKTFNCQNYDDINDYIFLKGNTKVITQFNF